MIQWITLAGTVVKEVSGWLSRKQDRKQAADKIKAQWEIAQTEKFPWFVSLFAGLHIIGPVDYAFYVSLQAAWPIESPEEMAHVVSTTLDAFPMWWTGAFVTILLAMMGIRANGQEKVRQSRQREREHKAEAEKEREKRRNREGEDASHRPTDRPDNLP